MTSLCTFLPIILRFLPIHDHAFFYTPFAGIWRPGVPIPADSCAMKATTHPQVSYELISIIGGGVG